MYTTKKKDGKRDYFSFEMIKSLVERLPIMLIPTWALMYAQPSASEDSTSSLIVLDVTFDFSSSMSMEEGSILDAVF